MSINEPLNLASKFKYISKKYGCYIAAGLMFAFIIYKKKQQSQNQLLKPQQNQTEIQKKITNKNAEQEKDKENLKISQTTSTKKQKKHPRQNIKKHFQSSDDEQQELIQNFKKPISKQERDNILNKSKSFIQNSMLKKSRVQHFDEEKNNQYIYSDIDNRQLQYLKKKYNLETSQNRVFASDQDDDTKPLNQYQKSQLNRLIKEQEKQTDQVFFKIMGEFVINEQQNENDQESDLDDEISDYE